MFIKDQKKQALKPDVCPDEILSCGHHILDACRHVIDQVWRQNLTVQIKKDGKPVTQLDYALETLMLSHIKEHRPSDGVLGEEFGKLNEGAEFTWIFDPIDDTAGLITGAPDFSVTLACMQGDDFICGMIDQPITKDRWVGAKGYAVSMNDSRTHVRQDVPLEESYIACNSKNSALQKIMHNAKIRVKQNALSFGMLVSGNLDAVVIENATVFDCAAMVPLVRAASGQVTDWSGYPVKKAYTGPVLATVCDRLHERLLKGIS